MNPNDPDTLLGHRLLQLGVLLFLIGLLIGSEIIAAETDVPTLLPWGSTGARRTNVQALDDWIASLHT